MWGYQGRTLGQRARHDEDGACRLLLISTEQAGGKLKLWEGTSQAAAACPTVHKPALHGVYDGAVRDGAAYRAELTGYVVEPVCAPEPVLERELELPEA
ncbi:hypothetical protein [Streptomyces niger]|uniref:hypothetical protein n=1 Tax=Streptomyces niger TaxID=66373 RepID=UPI00069CA2FB|nr:hypothetical protein [Streptomyces niger]